jgi:hypothetical protein
MPARRKSRRPSPTRPATSTWGSRPIRHRPTSCGCGSRHSNNFFNNDSIWLQLSGAVDPAGQRAYGIGTTGGLPVNLEECSGCGISGWGWEDDGWGAVNRNGVLLRFPQGAPQRIRIQVREDGVSVDQIVLSAVKYRTTRPGAAKDDTVILPSTERDR